MYSLVRFDDIFSQILGHRIPFPNKEKVYYQPEYQIPNYHRTR